MNFATKTVARKTKAYVELHHTQLHVLQAGDSASEPLLLSQCSILQALQDFKGLQTMDIPPLISELKTPKVLWYQNDISVVLRIMLTDVKDYFLQVDYRSLRFSTQHDDKDYYIWLNLFGTVIPEQTINENKGREIIIKLAKTFKWSDWLRLQKEQINNPMIRCDLEHNIPDDKPALKPNCPPPGAIHDLLVKKFISIRADVPTDDEDESEDETMEGWYL